MLCFDWFWDVSDFVLFCTVALRTGGGGGGGGGGHVRGGGGVVLPRTRGTCV